MKQLFLDARQTAHGDLVLVNAAHALACPQDACAGALTPALPGQPGVLLAAHAAAALRQLTAAACAGDIADRHGSLTDRDPGRGNGFADDGSPSTGGRAQEIPSPDACPIVAVSGYRPQSEQQAIWDDTLADKGETFTRRFVALPGCSEHQTGLAIDLAARAEHIDFIRPDFPDQGPCGRLRALAADYGFVQRYQADKQRLTGIAAEPWHFRYVGAPHAQAMVRLGLCLEEYLEFLAAESAPGHPWRFESGEGIVAITHCPVSPAGCCLPLPKSRRWQVSGTNAGGAVLTVWESDHAC